MIVEHDLAQDVAVDNLRMSHGGFYRGSSGARHRFFELPFDNLYHPWVKAGHFES